jgi:general secretion pathway protein L
MSKLHMIRILDESGDHCEWLHENAPAEPLNLNQLRIEDDSLILFVPTQDVTILPVNLPNMSSVQLRQALPYVLEENILSEPEKAHLAVNRLKDPEWVGVVSEDKMQSWLELAKATQAIEIKIVPDIDVLPLIEDAWVLAEDEQRVRLRMPSGFGWSVPVTEYEQFLQLTINQAKQLPSKIIIYTKTKPQPLNLGIPIEYRTDDFPLNAGDIQKGIILSQGAFKVSRASNLKKTWMIAGWILASSIALQGLHSIWKYKIVHHDIAQMDTEISELYHRVFPNAKTVNSPRTLLQRELDIASKQTANISFLNVLIKVSSGVEKNQNVQLQQLSYRQNIMQISIVLKNFQELEKLLNDLRKTGLSVTQDSAVSRGKQLEARLSIKG